VTVIDVGMNRLNDRGEVARIFRNSPQKLAAFDKKGKRSGGRRGSIRRG